MKHQKYDSIVLNNTFKLISEKFDLTLTGSLFQLVAEWQQIHTRNGLKTVHYHWA